MPTASRMPEPDHQARVRAYVAALPTGARRQLQQIRQLIRAAAPAAIDWFSYGIPGTRLEGRPLVWYAAWKDHCSLYPLTPGARRALGTALNRFETSKGTIRFPLDHPLPASLITRLVRARAKEVGGEAVRKTRR